MLYLVHKYKKKLESINMDLTHSKIMTFSSFSSKGVWLFNKSYNCAVHYRLQIYDFFSDTPSLAYKNKEPFKTVYAI